MVPFKSLGILAVCAMALLSSTVYAQKAGKGSQVEIQSCKLKLEEQRTPAFKDSEQGSGGANKRWARIRCEFNIRSPKKWIDELEVRWYVAVKTDENKKYAFMTQNVIYRDIENDGGKHNICTYIHSKFIDRYLNERVESTKISMYAEFYHDGKRIYRIEEKTGTIPDKWYTMGDKMMPFPNTLLQRQDTPFGVMDLDYYETEKKN